MSVLNPLEAPPTIPAQFQREMDLLKAQVKFPLADQDLMAMISGDSASIMAAAEKLHKQALALQSPPPAAVPAPVAAQPPVPTPAQSQSTPSPTPGPAPVPAATQATPPEQANEARYNELKYKLDAGIAEPHERQEFFMSSYRNAWNEHVGKMAGRTR